MPRNVKFLRDLLSALGLPGSAQRVVVVADVRDVPRVYFKGIIRDDERAEKVVGAVRAACVADVTVSDDCEVVVVPHEKAG